MNRAATRPDGLDELVEELAQLIRADGADLTAGVDEHRITFTLHIPDQACAECVMPAGILSSMFRQRVDETIGPEWAIAVDDPRESSPAPGS